MGLLEPIIFYICLIHLKPISGSDIYEERLILTPFIKNGNVKEARSKSEVNADNFCGLRSHSGFITVREEYNNNLFFWYFSHPEPENKPWIIWLQGGPGCTSLKGLFDIIGPLQLENNTLKLRNITLASECSVVFVDNPVGAGFSFTADDRGYTSDEDAVGEQLYEFLQQFLQVFPELRKAPLFVAGESYAGKYVPALGIQIHRHRNQTQHINFLGFMIGNGLIDPGSMMHYSSLCREIGILDDEQLDQLKELEQSVVKLIDRKRIVDASNKFNETIEFIKKHSGVNVFNFLKDPESRVPEFESYVQRSEVRKWIHVGNGSFHLNNQLVYEKMLPDIMNTTLPFVEELLEHYWFLSYSGQLDIMLAYGLSKHTYDLMTWSRKNEYLQAKRVRIRSSDHGRIVAYKKSGGNFVELLIWSAGHLVPAEQPEVAKFLFENFMAEAINKTLTAL